MGFHFIVTFEPRTGREAEFREELQRVAACSRQEPGCVSFQVFESFREPSVFAVHSEWADEAAFDVHAGLSHTVQFIAAAERLLTHPVQGLRLREIVERAASRE